MNDTPVFVIEETKTDDSESRNMVFIREQLNLSI